MHIISTLLPQKYYKFFYNEVLYRPSTFMVESKITSVVKYQLDLRKVHKMFQKIPPIRIVHEALLKELG
jgi:hypothetical protein